jgi:sialate O-acetylesterase
MLTVSSGADRAQASDLLVGDVWLCSGQSNMEYPVARALNGPGEVAGAGDGGLRLLTVPKDGHAAADQLWRPGALGGEQPAIGQRFFGSLLFYGP